MLFILNLGKQAYEKISMEDFKASMAGIYSESVLIFFCCLFETF